MVAGGIEPPVSCIISANLIIEGAIMTVHPQGMIASIAIVKGALPIELSNDLKGKINGVF